MGFGLNQQFGMLMATGTIKNKFNNYCNEKV